MTNAELIEEVRILADGHSQCLPEDACWLGQELRDLLNTPQEPKVPTCSNEGCDSILTIADPGSRCRQCVLQGVRS